MRQRKQSRRFFAIIHLYIVIRKELRLNFFYVIRFFPLFLFLHFPFPFPHMKAKVAGAREPPTQIEASRDSEVKREEFQRQRSLLKGEVRSRFRILRHLMPSPLRMCKIHADHPLESPTDSKTRRRLILFIYFFFLFPFSRRRVARVVTVILSPSLSLVEFEPVVVRQSSPLRSEGQSSSLTPPRYENHERSITREIVCNYSFGVRANGKPRRDISEGMTTSASASLLLLVYLFSISNENL